MLTNTVQLVVARGIGIRALLLLVLLHIASGPALTQQLTLTPAELASYEGVRIVGERLSPRILVGRVIHADPAGEATFQVGGEELTVDLLHAQYVRVFTGVQRGRTTLGGAGVGLTIGTLVGGSRHFVRRARERTGLGTRSQALEAAVAGGALGAAAGALIGSFIRYPKWESVTLTLEPRGGAATPQRTMRAAIVVRWTP